jgi:hypothetical protein
LHAKIHLQGIHPQAHSAWEDLLLGLMLAPLRRGRASCCNDRSGTLQLKLVELQPAVRGRASVATAAVPGAAEGGTVAEPSVHQTSRRHVLGRTAALLSGATAAQAFGAALAAEETLPGLPVPALQPQQAVATMPEVPFAQLAPGLNVTRVIKGCWQLSGGHHGDPATDRTVGTAAVEV